MNRLTLIFWLLLAATAQAQYNWQSIEDFGYDSTLCQDSGWWSSWSRGSDSTEITSLPYTASTNGTNGTFKVYYLAGDLWTNGSAITIGCDSCLLNGQGHTITFDSNLSSDNASARGDWGVHFNNGVDYAWIEHLTVRQAHADTNGAARGGTYGGDSATAFSFFGSSGVTYVTIDSCNWYVYGHDAQGVYGAEAGGNLADIEISGGYSENNALSYRDRQYSLASIGFADGQAAASADKWNYNIHDHTVGMTHHTGILAGARARIYNCRVLVDAYNDWENLDANAYGWGNAHGASEKGGFWPGSILRRVTVRTGQTWYGGRGLYVSSSAGKADSIIYVDSNDVRVWCGYSGKYNGYNENSDARGIRIRWGLKYVTVRRNLFWCHIDNDAATDWMYPSAHCIWINSDNEETESKSVHTTIESNDCRIIWLGDSPSEPEEFNQMATGLVVVLLDSAQYSGYADDNQSRYNSYRSLTQGMWLGYTSGGSVCDEWLSYRDSFFVWNADSATNSDTRLEYTWCSGLGTTNNMINVAGGGSAVTADAMIVDPYMSGWTWDNVSCQQSAALDHRIRMCRTVKVTVVDSNATVVPGAVVRFAFDNSGTPDTTEIDTTNASGLVYDTTDARAWRWSGCTETYDSTFSWTISASYGEDAADTTLQLDMTTQMGKDYPLVLTLSQTDMGGEEQATLRKIKGAKMSGGTIR